MKKLQKNQKGFTIIEVLIVLAIAGLIMVIVFLAVPALQRNSRNTQRTADASKIAAAVAQCMANRNGVTTSCDNVGSSTELQNAGGLDMTKLSQITTLSTGTTDPNNVSEARFGFGQKCSNDGAGIVGGTPRQAVVRFSVERNDGLATPRCIDV